MAFEGHAVQKGERALIMILAWISVTIGAYTLGVMYCRTYLSISVLLHACHHCQLSLAVGSWGRYDQQSQTRELVVNSVVLPSPRVYQLTY